MKTSSKNIVELMGGHIHAQEDVKNGAIFIFTIRTTSFFLSESTSHIQVEKEDTKTSHKTTSTNDKLHILVAEDNPIHQMLMERILYKLGHTFDCAKNGHEVMEMLGRSSYDLIFMDLQMPEMDGFKTTRMIVKEIPEQVRPDIIAVTSRLSEIDKEQCLSIGMIDFVNKPIKISTIEHVLERCLQTQ